MITIRISSTRQGEGKTTIAMWLEAQLRKNAVPDFLLPHGMAVERHEEGPKRPADLDTKVYIIEEASRG
jgi:hypothetical protein